jgi:hypothetical protein
MRSDFYFQTRPRLPHVVYLRAKRAISHYAQHARERDCACDLLYFFIFISIVSPSSSSACNFVLAFLIFDHSYSLPGHRPLHLVYRNGIVDSVIIYAHIGTGSAGDLTFGESARSLAQSAWRGDVLDSGFPNINDLEVNYSRMGARFLEEEVVSRSSR